MPFKTIGNTKQLAQVTGLSEVSLEQLPPDVQNLLYEKPQLAQGFIDKTYTLDNGTVVTNDSYKNSKLYEKLQNLKAGDTVDSDTIKDMFKSMIPYSYYNYGDIPDVSFVPTLTVADPDPNGRPLKPGQVTKNILLTFMDKMVAGLAQNDLPKVNMSLNAVVDTRIGSLLGYKGNDDAMNKYLGILVRPDYKQTSQNWVNTIYRVAANNPVTGKEMTFVGKDAIDVNTVTKADMGDYSTTPEEYDSLLKQAKELKRQGVPLDKAYNDINVSSGVNKGIMNLLHNVFYDAGYGSDMVIATNPSTGKPSIAFRQEVSGIIDDGNATFTPVGYSGGEFSVPVDSLSNTLIDRLKLEHLYDGSTAFKSVGKRIAGKNYMIRSFLDSDTLPDDSGVAQTGDQINENISSSVNQ